MNILSILLQINVTEAAGEAAQAVKPQISMSLWDLALKGGWIMLPIIILAIAAVYIFFERFFSIKKAAQFENNFIDRIRDYIHEGKIDAALNLCSNTGQTRCSHDRKRN